MKLCVFALTILGLVPVLVGGEVQMAGDTLYSSGGESEEMQPLPAHWRRGMSFFALDRAAMNATDALAEVKSLPTVFPGINWVNIAFQWFVENVTASDVFADPTSDGTPSLDSLEQFLTTAHSAGLNVLVKPAVVTEGPATFWTMNPDNATRWFETYWKLMEPLATLCEAQGVASLSVGLELQLMSRGSAGLTHLWVDLIRKVRAVYSGELTYCSEPLSRETQDIEFWDQLDYIGTDLYVPYVLSREANATLNDLSKTKMEAVFEYVLDAVLLKWMKNQTANYSNPGFPKHLVVTEGGYPSCNSGMQNPAQTLPHGCGITGGADFEQNNTVQAVGTQVAWTGLVDHASELYKGVFYFWYGQPGSGDWIGDYNNKTAHHSRWPCSWTPQGKPETMEVIKKAFALP